MTRPIYRINQIYSLQGVFACRFNVGGYSMIRIAVVEDRKQDSQLLCEYLHQYEGAHKLDISVETFLDGEDISVDYACQFDIIFMDIMMEFVDGMSAAEEIRRRDESVIIIFTTTMTDYAVKGYQVGALDYLLKPITYYAFSRCFDRALTKLPDSGESPFLMLSLSDGKRKIEFRDIYWIESRMHYLTFSTKKGEFRTYMRMKDIEQVLSGQGFFRINKGTIVNLKYVDAVGDDNCVVNETSLPVSRRKKAEFLEALNTFLCI